MHGSMITLTNIQCHVVGCAWSFYNDHKNMNTSAKPPPNSIKWTKIVLVWENSVDHNHYHVQSLHHTML